LDGEVNVFFEDGTGQRAEAVLGRWDCVSCPPNVIHGVVNMGVEPAYVQVMLGKAQPALMSYSDAELQRRRDEHLTARISTIDLPASPAHEPTHPPPAILSNAQAAQRLLDATPAHLEEIREILTDIVLDDNRASQVIQRLRSLARREPPEFAALDLAAIIRDAVLLLHSDAVLRSCHIVLDIDSGLPRVWGDRVELQQVVLNLLLNAFDA